MFINSYFGRGSSWWKNLGCPIWNCEIHSDWNSSSSIPVEDFEAVIFHDPTWTNRSLAPPKRTSQQRYIFLNMEPPGFHSYLKKWNESSSFFNWTLTYRWDSDITIPYGFFRPFTDNEIRNHQTFGKIKSNFIFYHNFFHQLFACLLYKIIF